MACGIRRVRVVFFFFCRTKNDFNQPVLDKKQKLRHRIPREVPMRDFSVTISGDTPEDPSWNYVEKPWLKPIC